MADEYTPSTEEIREQVAWQFDGDAEKRAEDAFDRWLAAHDREVVKAASGLERIKQALDNNFPAYRECLGKDKTCPHHMAWVDELEMFAECVAADIRDNHGD